MDMIGGIHKHGRTSKDNQNLFNHLVKDARKIEIVNSVAMSLDDLMSDMALMRDATKADAAFYHVFLSPSSDMTDDQLRQAAQTVVKHLGAEDHPYAIIYHDKDRRPGGGSSHVHVVIGRVDSSLSVLENKFEKIRLETAVRICEYESGETPVLGRHYKSSMKWLEQHRPEVADWLYGYFGNDGQKPASAASPDMRHSLERKGVNLSGVKDLLNRAYVESTDGQSFADNVRKYGLVLEAGQKTGVFIIKLGDVEVSSVDRLLKLKRADVSKLLSNVNFHKKEIFNERTDSNGQTRESDLQQSTRSRAEAESAARSTLRRSSRNWGESASKHSGSPRSDIKFKSNSARVAGQASYKAGRSGVEYAQEKITSAALIKIKISPVMRSHMNFINERKERVEKEHPDIWQQSLFDRIRQRFSKAFLRLKDCMEMMRMCSDDSLKHLSEVEKQRLKEPFITHSQPDRSYSISNPRL